MNFSERTSEETTPTSLESVAGFDLNELEKKAIEKKREEIQRKKAEREAREQKKPAEEVPAVSEDTEDDAEQVDTEEDAEQPPDTSDEDESTEPSKSDEETSMTAPPEKPAPEEIGHHAACNLCYMYPITGVRFRCISDECPDFDLCRSCFDKKEHDQTHEMVVYSTPKQVIHPEVCNLCKASPIVGTLYVCTDESCPAQISCGACFAKGHNRSHAILMAREVMDDEGEPDTDRPIHAGIACSYCAMDPIVGTRYKCMHVKCPKYNLCEDCVNKGIHDATHTMQPLKTPEEADYLHPGTSEGSPLVIGLRVYTKKSAKVNLKAQLKHGSMARQ